MSSGALGFFLGAAPGVAYVLRSMVSFQREIAKAQGLARDAGDLFDFHLSFKLKADDVPPDLSSAPVSSSIPHQKEIEREEAFFRRADHWFPA
jgi:hypothetical protein